MATKKGAGSTRNGRDSQSKRLGVKEFGGEWNSTKPVTGIKDIVTDNIQILTSTQMSQSFSPIIPPNTTDATYANIPQFVLSSQKSILENYNTIYVINIECLLL